MSYLKVVIASMYFINQGGGYVLVCKLKVIQTYVYVTITASFRYQSLLVLKYVPGQLSCQIRTSVT